MQRICWNCKFFQHSNSSGDYPNGGLCRRNAPKGRDANGLAANKRYYETQYGVVNATIYKAVNSPLPLFIAQQATGALPSVPATGGLNDDAIFPCVNDGLWMIDAISLRCSLANTGAATVGAAPKIQVEAYVIDGTSKTLYHTIDLDIVNEEDVGIEGNTDDALVIASASGLYTENASSMHAPSLGGYAIKLTDDDPDLIGEIRNPIIGVLLSRYIPAIINPSFPYLQRGDTMQCGEFVQNPGTIPALP